MSIFRKTLSTLVLATALSQSALADIDPSESSNVYQGIREGFELSSEERERIKEEQILIYKNRKESHDAYIWERSVSGGIWCGAFYLALFPLAIFTRKTIKTHRENKKKN